MRKEKIKFYLKRPNEEGLTSIFLKLTYKGQQLKYYTDQCIEPILWDKEIQRPTKNKKQLKELRIANPNIDTILHNIDSRLEEYANSIVAYINVSLQIGIEVTSKTIREHLDDFTDKNDIIPHRSDLISYLEQFINDIESGERLTLENTQYASGTIKNYKGLLVQLNEFKDRTNVSFEFDDINEDWIDILIGYFNDKDYRINTIGRHIKQIKSVMKNAYKERLHTNTSFQDFRTLSNQVDTIYLSVDEVNTIRLLDLTDFPHLDLARDVFLIGCYTALRYSDYCTLCPEHFKKRNDKTFIEIHNQKTGKPNIIPVHPNLIPILEKYDYSIPLTQEQKLNKYIKEIGKLAEINEEVEKLEIIGGRKVKATSKKYEEITTHTARRSAATNMFKAGIPSTLIMKLTNHTSEKDFMKYIRIDREEAAIILSEFDYFN